jgi:hypothetical protein
VGETLIGLLTLAALVFVWRAGKSASKPLAVCMAESERKKTLDQILSGAISQDDAEKLAKSQENAGCTDDASAIRVAAKAAQSGDQVPHPPSGLTTNGGISSSSKVPPAGGGDGKTTHDVGTHVTSSGGNLYTLTAEDIAEGPMKFATAAGYDSVLAFITDQEGALKMENVAPPSSKPFDPLHPDPEAIAALEEILSDPAVFVTTSPLNKDLLLYHRLVPWKAGMEVHTLATVSTPKTISPAAPAGRTRDVSFFAGAA